MRRRDWAALILGILALSVTAVGCSDGCKCVSTITVTMLASDGSPATDASGSITFDVGEDSQEIIPFACTEDGTTYGDCWSAGVLHLGNPPEWPPLSTTINVNSLGETFTGLVTLTENNEADCAGTCTFYDGEVHLSP